jgi:GT2 family glycosyltransferase
MQAEPTVLAVLVLYEIKASRSPTFMSLCQVFAEPDLARHFRLLVYDNSASSSDLPVGIPIPVSYIHDPANGGLFAAYNRALRLAEEGRNEWLLLLDQDTLLTSVYVRALVHTLREAEANPRCAALAPKLISKNRIVSPARILWGGRLSPVDKTLTGMVPWEAMALNSATLLRVSAVREVGGFNPRFWLDYLDHWLFNRLYRAGYSLYVLDAALVHELSVTRMSDMSTARYKNILSAEGQFYRCCRTGAENKVYLVRLILRATKMLVSRNDRRLFSLTLSHLISHIRQGRSSASELPKR